MAPTSHKWKLALALPVVAAGLVLWIWAAGSPAIREPMHQGRPLRHWMRGHPRDYTPAVQAMGTNAIPFLLAELGHKDSPLQRFGEELLRRVIDAVPPWETARTRKYHARLALQILDTNATPSLLQAVFTAPFQLKEGHPSSEAAFALTWMASPEARAQILGTLSEALNSADAECRRAACLTFGAGNRGGLAEARQLIALTADPNPRVRASATRALITWQTNETEVLPALTARLDDEQPAVRRVAIEALWGRGTNAVAALPALMVAYTNESTKPRPAGEVDDVFRGAQALSASEIRWAIRAAIQRIDPASTPEWPRR